MTRMFSRTLKRLGIAALALAASAVLPAGAQTLVTATTRAALPVEPDQLLEVVPGEVREAA